MPRGHKEVVALLRPAIRGAADAKAAASRAAEEAEAAAAAAAANSAQERAREAEAERKAAGLIMVHVWLSPYTSDDYEQRGADAKTFDVHVPAGARRSDLVAALSSLARLTEPKLKLEGGDDATLASLGISHGSRVKCDGDRWGCGGVLCRGKSCRHCS